MTKHLLNYITKDNNNNCKLGNYETYDSCEKTLKNNENNKFKFPDRDTRLDDNILIEEKENVSDSLSNYLEKETKEKTSKLIRFAEDLCRASPNINLKSKFILNIGWRTQKFNFQVVFDEVNYKGERLEVLKLFNIRSILL